MTDLSAAAASTANAANAANAANTANTGYMANMANAVNAANTAEAANAAEPGGSHNTGPGAAIEAALGTAGFAAPADSAASALLGTYRRAPVTFVRGEGAELFDAAGRAHLDFTSGIAVNALGYGDHGVEEAVRAALATGLIHTSNLYCTEPAEQLARSLVAYAFPGRVFLCNSGAEANEGAFKFARRWARAAGVPHDEPAVPMQLARAPMEEAGAAIQVASAPKHEIVALRGAFHGRTMGALAATDRAAYRVPFLPLAGGITIVERDLADLETILATGSVAAVILEPVQGEGGVRVLDHGFLRAVRALTREHGALLICDEIQCGLGRTGRLFAYEAAGIEPDILTLAKPLAGGLPMGAVVVSERVAAAIEPGDHGTTFGGGPLVATVALHVVERLADPALLAHVREAGRFVREELGAIALRSGGRVRGVRGVGLIWGLDITECAAHTVQRALEAGLLICAAGEHTVRLLPPLVTPLADLARGLRVLEQVIGAAPAATATGAA